MSVTRDDRPTVQRRSNVKDSLSTQNPDKPVIHTRKVSSKAYSESHTHVHGGLGDYIPSKTAAKDALQQLLTKTPEGREVSTKVAVSLQKFFKFLYRFFLAIAALFSIATGSNAGIWAGIGTFLAMAIPATIMYGFAKVISAGIGVAAENVMKGEQGFNFSEFEKKAKAYKDLNQ